MPAYQNKDKNGKVIYTKTNGKRSWFFRCYYTDIYGNRKQRNQGYYFTQKEALEEERKFLNENAKKDNTDNSLVQFIDVFEEWQLFRKMQLKEQTYYGFEKRTNKYIKEPFKKYKLHFIKMNVINQWYDWLCDMPLSIYYKNTIISYLKDFLTYARDNYGYDGKIVSKIQKYRTDEPNDKPSDSEVNFWCYDEWETFIKIVDNYEDKVMYNFLYYTGLRFGEFDALNWNDFDPVNKTITVSKTLTNKVKDKRYIITKPKTKNSERVVDLDDTLNEMLIEYKNYKKSHSYNFSENNFIFGDINYVAATTFKRRLDNYINRLKDIYGDFKRITPHGFRHSHVSLLIDLGCDSRDVAERIGDTVEVVEKIYYHMFPKRKKMTINRLNELRNKKKL